MAAQLIFFGILAAIAVVCAIGMIIENNPVRCALFLVLVLFCVALLFLTLHALFIAAVQIIVYAGAIMVLFVFVIMLLNLGAPERIIDRLQVQKPFSWFLGLITIAILAAVISAVPVARDQKLTTALAGPREIGLALFSPQWLFPFEAISILLLIAAIGAVMLAKKRI